MNILVDIKGLKKNSGENQKKKFGQKKLVKNPVKVGPFSRKCTKNGHFFTILLISPPKSHFYQIILCSTDSGGFEDSKNISFICSLWVYRISEITISPEKILVDPLPLTK